MLLTRASAPLFLRGILSCFVSFKTFRTGNRVARDLAKSNLHHDFCHVRIIRTHVLAYCYRAGFAFCAQVPVVFAPCASVWRRTSPTGLFSLCNDHWRSVALSSTWQCQKSKQSIADIAKVSLSGGKSGSAYP